MFKKFKKTKRAALGVGMAIAVPAVCVVGGIALGTVLSIGMIVMTAQELMENDETIR